MSANLMNKKQTKLLVENWRKVLNGELLIDDSNIEELIEEGIDYLNEERLDEGAKENILMSIIALSSVLPFNAAKASPRGDLRAAAASGFNGMDARRNTDSGSEKNDSGAERGDRSGLNDRSREAFDEMDSELDKVKKYIKVLRKAKKLSPKSAVVALDMYTSGDKVQKDGVVGLLRRNINAVNPAILKNLDKNIGGKEYQAFDRALENSSGIDSKGSYIMRGGKKFYMKHSETHETNVIGDEEALKGQEEMRNRYKSK